MLWARWSLSLSPDAARQCSPHFLSSHQVILQNSSSSTFFPLKIKIGSKGHQSVKGFFLPLCDLCIVKFWLSEQWNLFFPFFFSDVHVQCAGVAELNAKLMPCSVWSPTCHPSSGHRDLSYLILEMTFLHSSSKIAVYVNHPGTPSAMPMSRGLNLLLTLGWQGYLSDSSERCLSENTEKFTSQGIFLVISHLIWPSFYSFREKGHSALFTARKHASTHAWLHFASVSYSSHDLMPLKSSSVDGSWWRW